MPNKGVEQTPEERRGSRWAFGGDVAFDMIFYLIIPVASGLVLLCIGISCVAHSTKPIHPSAKSHFLVLGLLMASLGAIILWSYARHMFSPAPRPFGDRINTFRHGAPFTEKDKAEQERSSVRGPATVGCK